VKERCEVTNDGRVTEHVTTTDVPRKGKDEVHFNRAMLSIRGTSHGPVSVCLSSQVRVLLKRLNIGSHKQHRTIA